MFIQLVKNTTDSEDKLPVKYFWRNFNIKKASDNTGDAQAEMLQFCMNGVWENIWHDIATDFHSFNPEEETGNLRHDFVRMASTVGSEDIDEANVAESFQLHMKEFSNENLLQLEKDYMIKMMNPLMWSLLNTIQQTN
jgi:hypothetical protein